MSIFIVDKSKNFDGGRILKNIDIRQYAARKRVNFWEISEKMGYSHESSFSRLLRHELPDEKKKQIFAIIDELADE